MRRVTVTSGPTAEPQTAKAGAASPTPATAVPPEDIHHAVERIAAEQSVPPLLVHSVIRAESNYDPAAVSPKGAQGLMQLIPATARRFGVSDVFNPVENIQGGTKYLKYLLELYGNNYPLALAAYNAGEGAVARYGGIPPYAETRVYVDRVAKHLKEAELAAASAVSPAKENGGKPEVAQPAGPNHIQEIVEPDGSVHYVTR